MEYPVLKTPTQLHEVGSGKFAKKKKEVGSGKGISRQTFTLSYFGK
jgi:hypothetical protein